MEFNLDSAISIFFSTVDNQNNYWSLYSGVAFGLLAFLSATNLRPSLIKIAVSAFIVFGISNLIMVCSLQSNLLDISEAVSQYLMTYKEQIPKEFHVILQNIANSTKPIWVVFIFHFFSTITLSIAMVYVGNLSSCDSDEAASS